MLLKYPKRIRLPLAAYRELVNPCAITICTHEKSPIFQNLKFGLFCIDLLKQLCNEGQFKIFAYCFMADHIHLLIQGDGSTSIIDLMRKFKSISTLKSREFGFSGRIYQPRFYDHFLKGEDDIEKHTRYILENPIRKGMVKRIQDYPLLGSLVFNLKS